MNTLEHFETKGYAFFKNVNDNLEDIPSLFAQGVDTFETRVDNEDLEDVVHESITSNFNKEIKLDDKSVWELVQAPEHTWWHFDHLPGDAGSTSPIIGTYYYDTMTEESGGAIQFMWHDDDGKKQIDTLYPEAGDLILIHNKWDDKGQWMHRVSRMKDKNGRRRIAGFYYDWA